MPSDAGQGQRCEPKNRLPGLAGAGIDEHLLRRFRKLLRDAESHLTEAERRPRIFVDFEALDKKSRSLEHLRMREILRLHPEFRQPPFRTS